MDELSVSAIAWQNLLEAWTAAEESGASDAELVEIVRALIRGDGA